VNGKGVKFYTAQSAFLSVVMKKHNIITYEEDSTWSGFWGLGQDFGVGLTGE
jgi:hypothetical protein